MAFLAGVGAGFTGAFLAGWAGAAFPLQAVLFVLLWLSGAVALGFRYEGQTLWERAFPLLEYMFGPGKVRVWRKAPDFSGMPVVVVEKGPSLGRRLLVGFITALVLFALLLLLKLLSLFLWVEQEPVQARPPSQDVAACGPRGEPGMRWFRLNTEGDFDGWALFATPGGVTLPLELKVLPDLEGATAPFTRTQVAGRFGLYLDASLPGMEAWVGVETARGVVAEHSLFLESGGYTGPAIPPARRWYFPLPPVKGEASLYVLNATGDVTKTLVRAKWFLPDEDGDIEFLDSYETWVVKDPGGGLMLEGEGPIVAERVVRLKHDFYDVPPLCPDATWYFPPAMGEEVHLSFFNPRRKEVQVEVTAWGNGRSASITFVLPPRGTKVIEAGTNDGWPSGLQKRL